MRAEWAVVAGLLWLVAACDTMAPYEYGARAGAPPAERPQFTVGDEFWFDTDDRSIIVEVFAGVQDGRLVFRRDSQQEVLVFSPDLALVEIQRPFGSDRLFDPDNGMLEFPLFVGKTWTRDFGVWSPDRQGRSNRSRSCAVVDAGQANVPAGSFAAYRVECTLRELGGTSAAREEILYAPEVGRVIVHFSRDRGIDTRLIEFSRAP